MFHLQLSILILLYLFFILNHSIICFSVPDTAIPLNNGESGNNNGENGNGDVRQLPLNLQMQSRHLKIFTYEELATATGNFGSRLLIGKGTFGSVFKGWVDKTTYGPSKDGVGMAVAVKKFDLGGFEEYITWQSEVELWRKLSHPNIVNVLGYCKKMEKFLVVYEYMEGGSLQKHLFSSDGEPLSWGTRLKIAIGAARGFAFLHSTEKRDVYRQFKSHNILLDSDFSAKLSDIQLAEISYSFADYYFPGLRRTVIRTYDFFVVPPEYMATGHLNKSGHVYCFGVLLLEILAGAPASVVTKRSGNRRLVGCTQKLLSRKRKVKELIDRRLRGAYPIEDVFQYAQLTLKCLDPLPKNRPLMDQVLKTLEHIHRN